MQYSEIRHNHIWGPLVEPGRADAYEDSILAGISIDAWKTDNGDEPGTVLANVILSLHGDIIVDFHDNGVRLNKQVWSHINAAKDQLRQIWTAHTADEHSAQEQDEPHDEEGVCPMCGAEIKYDGPHEIDDDGGTVPWKCPNCGATGKEGYNRVFDQHYNVCDAEGNPAPGRDNDE